MLKAPHHMIRTNRSKHEQIEAEGGGAHITVPQNESAEQTGVGAVRGIVERLVAVHHEQKHVPVSQVSAGRYPLGAVFAVLVAERQVPRRVLGHEVEHPGGQLVVVDACIPR